MCQPGGQVRCAEVGGPCSSRLNLLSAVVTQRTVRGFRSARPSDSSRKPVPILLGDCFCPRYCPFLQLSSYLTTHPAGTMTDSTTPGVEYGLLLQFRFSGSKTILETHTLLPSAQTEHIIGRSGQAGQPTDIVSCPIVNSHHFSCSPIHSCTVPISSPLSPSCDNHTGQLWPICHHRRPQQLARHQDYPRSHKVHSQLRASFVQD